MKTDIPVDTILVLSHEKLSIDLNRLFPNQTVLRLPKSGGVVDLDEHYKQAIQAFQIRSYFYGEPSLPPTLSNLTMGGGRVVGLAGQLTPYSFQIGWETLTIVRVGEGMSFFSGLIRKEADEVENAAPSSALPLGSSRALSSTRISRVDPSGPAHVHRLMNSVLAIVHIIPGDRIIKEKVDKSEIKPEVKSEIKAEEQDPAEGQAEGDGEVRLEDGETEEAAEENEDEDDEVPYIEDVGTREVAGFIVMSVFLPFLS
jgi:polyribonucleotide 5'-hydroxyl-kinase